jgi:hypothetical protein
MIEVVEIKRTEHEQLQIRWRYRNPTDKPIELLAKSPPTGAGPKLKFVKGIYYEAGKLQSSKAYLVPIVKTEKGDKWLCKGLSAEAVVVDPNKEWEFWAVFYLPRGDDDRITLRVPGTPPIEGLQVPKAAKK